MSSSIYNHRSLQPQGPPQAGPVSAHSPARVSDSLESIRQEFDLISQELTMSRTQKDEFENRIHAQINELNHIKQMVYELENQHTKARQQYDDENARLRAEIVQLRQANQAQAQQVQAQVMTPHAVAPPNVNVNGPPPPNSLPPSNASPHTSHAGMGTHTGAGPGPAYGEPPYGYRSREEREIRDSRDARDREIRDREIRDTRDMRDTREREQRERERDQRERDMRDVKRIKTETRPPVKNNDRIEYSHTPGHKSYPSEASSSTALVQSSSVPPPSGSASTSFPPASGSAPIPAFLDDLALDTLPPEYKKEGTDWFAIFNPSVKRVLDVDLKYTFAHESVVCCVRFSADGKYLATGCNRTAQIYDTTTGAKACVLNDDQASPVGDLYIRSVCFSPDGKYLATGAEDKTIRIWEIAKRRIRRVFEGHTQEIYSLDFSKNGRLIVSGSGDRTARIWDMETGMQKVLEINEPDGVDAGVTSVAISPDGRLVAAGSLDTIVRIWEVSTGNLIERLRGHRDSVYSVAFTPDGKGIVSGSLDKTLKQWDISALVSGSSRKEPLPPSSANGPTTPDGSNGSGVSRNKDGGERGSVNTLNFTGHKDYVLSVAVSHDGNWVVSGSKDRGVQFWEQQTAAVQLMLQGHKNSVISIDLSPAGGILATGSGDMQARIWTYKTL